MDRATVPGLGLSPQMTDRFCSALEYGGAVTAVVVAPPLLAVHSVCRLLASPVQPPTPIAGSAFTMARSASVRLTMSLSLADACSGPEPVTMGAFWARVSSVLNFFRVTAGVPAEKAHCWAVAFPHSDRNESKVAAVAWSEPIRRKLLSELSLNHAGG